MPAPVKESRIIGVDPGLSKTGWGMIVQNGRTAEVIDSGTISTSTSVDFSARLAKIYSGLHEVVQEFAPAVLAVEDVIYAANVQIALKLGHARGTILLVAAHCALPVVSYSPKEIKQSVTGNGNASKIQMQRMIQSILNLEQLPTPHDIADALAVALCHLNRLHFQLT